jgi:hypothetical protein
MICSIAQRNQVFVYFCGRRGGLLQVKIKITRQSNEEDFQCLILLPSDYNVIDMLIMEEHLTASHAVVQISLCIPCEQFWILEGRNTVHNVLSRCVLWGKLNLYLFLKTDQWMLLCFEVDALDLAGPLQLRCGKDTDCNLHAIFWIYILNWWGLCLLLASTSIQKIHHKIWEITSPTVRMVQISDWK